MMTHLKPPRGLLPLAVLSVLTALGGAPLHGQDRPAALTELAPYLGEWRAEPSTAPDGRGFRFGYSLQWFDPGHTVVEMLITQNFDDGETRVLWMGFKGRDPASGGIYYHGFSPSGRVARGEVAKESADVLTVYEGWGPTGAVARIQDRFLPVEDDSFMSITSVWRDEAWREIMRDTWTRVDG